VTPIPTLIPTATPIPASWSYSVNPAIYTKGVAITDNIPSYNGGIGTIYSANPPLPAGLILDIATGVISGTPGVVATQSNYVVTATNSGGFKTASLTITVIDVAPSSLHYSMNPAIYTKGVAITNNAPSNSGGFVSFYSVSPALPSGLSLNAGTGIISGTPKELAPEGHYIVTATNSGGATTASLTMTVNDMAPSSLLYSHNPAIYTKGTFKVVNSPSNQGGTITSYSITPVYPPA
jgi:hypothetical protein